LACRLLNAPSVVNKIEELHFLLYNTDCDIVFGTETWLHGLLEPHAQYTIVRKDRDSCKGGGVCAFVSKRRHVIPVTIDVKFCNVETVCFDWVVPVNCVRSTDHSFYLQYSLVIASLLGFFSQ